MSIHVAILKRPYIEAILDGRKTIESRMTRTYQPPHDQIATGDRLFLKASSGPIMATAIAGQIETYRDLEPRDVERLQRQYQPTVGGSDEYWQAKFNARWATFVEMTQVEPCKVGPSYKTAYMKAWYVLPDGESPIVDVVLTEGAIRNGYIAVPKGYAHFEPGPGQVKMPTGEVVEQGVNERYHLGGRTWKRCHTSCQAKGGDTLRIVALGSRRFLTSYRFRETS